VLAVVLASMLPWPGWLNAASVDSEDLRLSTLLALLGVAFSLTSGLGQKIDLARQRGHAVAAWQAAASIAGPAGGVVVAAVNPSLPLVVGTCSLLPPAVLGLQTVLVVRSLPRALRPHQR
jgi:hypothetical protein